MLVDYSKEVEALPESLRMAILPYLTADDHGSVATMLEEYHSSGSNCPAAVVVALACARVRDAQEVMVDEVLPACRDSLLLLEEASQLSDADVARVRRLRAEVQAVLDGYLSEEIQARSEAASAIALDEASAEQLADEAQRAWKRRDLERAAELFLEAAEQEKDEASRRHRYGQADQSMTSIVRAAQCLAEAGKYEEAAPLFEEAIAFDWRAGGLWADRHTVEWAFGAALKELARLEDWDGFRERWYEALARCDELQMAFPHIHSLQEELLQLCVEASQLEFLPHLVDRTEARGVRLTKRVRASVEAAKALCG